MMRLISPGCGGFWRDKGEIGWEVFQTIWIGSVKVELCLNSSVVFSCLKGSRDGVSGYQLTHQ